MRNFSSNDQCGVVEKLACFRYSLNDKNLNFREKQNMITKDISEQIVARLKLLF